MLFLQRFFAATFYSVYYVIRTSGNVKSIKRFVGVCVRKKNVVKVIILLLVVQAVD